MEDFFDLRDFILTILRKWRLLFSFIIVLAILGGLYKFIPGIQKINNSSILDDELEEYSLAIQNYETQKKSLERTIKKLNSDLEYRQTYNENSLLMQINPFDKRVLSIDYYINTNYKIMPDVTFQNPDMTPTILTAYHTRAMNGELFQYILDTLNGPYDLELQYLQELLSVEVNKESSLIQIKFTSMDEDMLQIAREAVKEYFEKQKDVIQSVIYDHELKIVNDTISTYVDLNLESIQEQNQQKALELNKTLEEKTTELTTLKEPTKNLTSFGSVIKSTVKFMLLGAIGGVGLAVLLIFFLDMMDIKVRSERDLTQRYNINVLGTISKGEL